MTIIKLTKRVKHLYTSYYSHIGALNKAKNQDFLSTDLNIWSIAIKKPAWYNGPEYLKLAPPEDILYKYKKDHDEEAYTRAYKARVLDKLDPREIAKELGEGAVMLCWESSEKFCHRHLVAYWFNTAGIEVKELD